MSKFGKVDKTPNYVKGEASISRNKNSATVLYEDKKSGKFSIALDDLDNDRAVGFAIENGVIYDVCIDANKTPPALVSVRPWAGIYKAKVIDFTHAEGKEPAPTTRMFERVNPKTGQKEENPSTTFGAVIQVTEGDCSGAKYLLYLQYRWFTDNNGKVGLEQPKDMSKATTYHMVEAFLEHTGADTEIPDWSDNILPDLLTSIKKAKRAFNIVVQNGKITQITSVTPVKKKASKPNKDTEED